MSAVVLFSVLLERLLNFDHRLLYKSHKFANIKRVVPKLGVITVLRMKLLKEKNKKQKKRKEN